MRSPRDRFASNAGLSGKTSLMRRSPAAANDIEKPKPMNCESEKNASLAAREVM
jgi:hypothetical protein